MDVDKVIKEVQARIFKELDRIKWLEQRRSVLEDLPEATFWNGQLDFDGLKHPEVIKVVRGLGGKWNKQLNGADHKSVDYTQKIDGMDVRIWQGQPPPSCRVIEVEEVVPAHVVPEHTVPEQRRKVRKMICQGQEPIVVALAKAQP